MHLTFIFLILFFTEFTSNTPIIHNLCTKQTNNRFIEISSAKIQKITTFQYSLSLFDTPIKIIKNDTEFIFQGNFSKLILKNYALNKQFTYYGTQLIFKIPANHIFTKQKIPDLQVQILHSVERDTKQIPYKFVILSQLYIISKFQNKISTVLSKYFNFQSSNGTMIQTSKIIQVIEGFPLLMYKGSAETFPCRNDLLCFIKREHQLIGQQDFDSLKRFVSMTDENKNEKRYFLRKNIYQINSIKKQKDKKVINNEL